MKQKETSRLYLFSSPFSIKIKCYKRSLEGDNTHKKLQWHSKQEEWKSLTLAGNTVTIQSPSWTGLTTNDLEVKNNLAK